MNEIDNEYFDTELIEEVFGPLDVPEKLPDITPEYLIKTISDYVADNPEKFKYVKGEKRMKSHMKEPDQFVDSVLVGLSYTKSVDDATLVVGRKRFKKAPDIINAFQGEEAIALYEKLTNTKVERKISNDQN